VLPPFVSQAAASCSGRTRPRLLNPLSEEEALLRPALLPGLLAAAVRNASRGLADVALFETGTVFLGQGRAGARAPRRRRPARATPSSPRWTRPSRRSRGTWAWSWPAGAVTATSTGPTPSRPCCRWDARWAST
jgi:phenylalanyl-tRNA synthetase beta subunit